MIPGGSGEPTGELADLINRDFGSFDHMKANLSASTTAVQVVNTYFLFYPYFTICRVLVGVGWVTIRKPRSFKLLLARIKTFLKLPQACMSIFVPNGHYHLYQLVPTS